MSGRFLGRQLSSFQIIILGFLGLVLAGTALLMIPAATADGSGASLSDAFFTATSAVCVTGLVIKDTALYWSYFGQAVILVLIEIGGLGIITAAVFIAVLSGKKINLLERTVLRDAISTHQTGGGIRMTKFIVKIALIIEFLGAAVMLPVFCGRYGMEGIWMSVFHSVSAFCNAGFDIMGKRSGAFSSLTSFAGNPVISFTICMLIIAGGLGFMTWDDVVEHKLHFRKYKMQSKVILAMTAALIIVPGTLFYLTEFREGNAMTRVCLSVFQAVTPRTAGFNTADLNAMSGVARCILIALMLIGGAPGSTAGGMKTTTVAVIGANSFSVFRRDKNVQVFGRRVEDSTVKEAVAILTLYILFAAAGAMAVSAAEHLPVSVCLYETSSAIGTVGLSLGITPTLGLFSRLVLAGLMFFGRVGGLTLVLAAVSAKRINASHCPSEKIAVG